MFNDQIYVDKEAEAALINYLQNSFKLTKKKKAGEGVTANTKKSMKELIEESKLESENAAHL
jgi:hypothetical protein